MKNSYKMYTILLIIFLCNTVSYATNFQDAIRGNNDASKNIYSKSIIVQSDSITKIQSSDGKETLIKHKLSINHIDDEKYEIIEDEKADRIMIKIFSNNRIYYAQDGFYKLNNKIYYFDSNGHMVLGPCVDKEGNHYFFSYETGELLEG